MEPYPGDDYGLASPVFPPDATGHGTIYGDAKQTLEVLVVFTDMTGTQAALQMADGLAQKLDARIRLLVPYEVPYVLPLAKPAVPVEFLEGQIREMAGQSHLEVMAHICLCRDRRRALESLLSPDSLIVVGGKKRWWPTSAQKLSRDLQKCGHHVIFAELR